MASPKRLADDNSFWTHLRSRYGGNTKMEDMTA